MGTIEAGKLTDPIIVDSNTLDDIQFLQNITAFIRNERWLFPQELLVSAAEYARLAEPATEKGFDDHN